MKIYLATWLTDRTLGDSLTDKNANKRLLSFFFLKEQGVSSRSLKEYKEIGKLDMRKRK